MSASWAVGSTSTLLWIWSDAPAIAGWAFSGPDVCSVVCASTALEDNTPAASRAIVKIARQPAELRSGQRSGQHRLQESNWCMANLNPRIAAGRCPRAFAVPARLELELERLT